MAAIVPFRPTRVDFRLLLERELTVIATFHMKSREIKPVCGPSRCDHWGNGKWEVNDWAACVPLAAQKFDRRQCRELKTSTSVIWRGV
jgi:hypothetical protein